MEAPSCFIVKTSSNVIFNLLHPFLTSFLTSSIPPRSGTEEKKFEVEGLLAEMQMKRSELRALKVLGAGQFGKVLLAVQGSSPIDSKQVAVKMLRPGASAQDHEEFLKEAETMVAIAGGKGA